MEGEGRDGGGGTSAALSSWPLDTSHAACVLRSVSSDGWFFV